MRRDYEKQTVFAVVLSCGTGTETPLFGSVTDNVAEADRTGGSTIPYDIPATAWSGGTTPTIATVQAGFHPENSSGSPQSVSLVANLAGSGLQDHTLRVTTNHGNAGDQDAQIWTDSGFGDHNGDGFGCIAANTELIGYIKAHALVAVRIPESVKAFANDADYTVTVTWKAHFGRNSNEPLYAALATSANPISGTSARYENVRDTDGKEINAGSGATFDSGEQSLTQAIVSGENYVLMAMTQEEVRSQRAGVQANRNSLTFTITRAANPTDNTRPTISSAAAEDGPQLKTSGGASVNQSHLGSNSGLSANTTNITLGKAVSQATFTANGQNYYKKLTLTVRDGDPNSAAFYYGVRDLNITAAPGGVSGAWAHVGNLPQGNKENETTTASGTNYYITASETENAASQATFTLYFKANGTYTIKFEDNASAFGGTNAACDPITITVSGIDTAAPTATELFDGSPADGVFADTNFEGGTWASVGQVSQSLKGMDGDADLAKGNSAWAFFFARAT